MTIKDSTIQIRIDSKTKKDAQKVFNRLGLDFSSAIKIFLRNSIIQKAIPFWVVTENGYTVSQERRMLKDIEHAKRYGKRYATIQEAHKDILGE